MTWIKRTSWRSRLAIILRNIRRHKLGGPAKSLTPDLAADEARDLTIARLGALEDRLRAILTNAADAIFVIDICGKIESTNPAAERLTGWNDSEMVGLSINLIMDEPYRTTHQGHIERYLKEGRSGILNVGPRMLPLRHKNGGTIPIELSIGEAFIAGERKFIGVSRDISARLQKDEALRATNAELRAKIAELETLSAGLEAQKLALQALTQETQQARKLAESANEAKSRFIATMSHELRTPLNGILTVADALTRRDLGPDELEMAKIIQSSGQGLLSILNEVLDLARIEAGALTIEARPFSPADLVDAVAKVWSFAAKAKGIELHAKAVRRPLAAVGDEQRLRQVLSNLVSNAIKFTDRGAVTVSVRRRGDHLRFQVADTGPGIEPAQRERMFEPFVQAQAGADRKHGGSGLGLAICRELVTLMGGRIWAEEADGGGARIVVELPFRAGALEPATGSRSRAAAQAAALTSKDDLGGLDPLILVAEDHPVNRKVASIVLDEAGVRSEFVEDGEAAIAAVGTGRFDLVLMDVQMPKMSGLAASRAIRRLSGPAAAIPIIAVTANSSPEEIAECRAAGMNDFVSKPIKAEELMRLVFAHLADVTPGDRGAVPERSLLRLD